MIFWWFLKNLNIVKYHQKSSKITKTFVRTHTRYRLKNLENAFSGHGGYPQKICTRLINILLKFEPPSRLGCSRLMSILLAQKTRKKNWRQKVAQGNAQISGRFLYGVWPPLPLRCLFNTVLTSQILKIAPTDTKMLRCYRNRRGATTKPFLPLNICFEDYFFFFFFF